jgi:hypothetical protein
MVSGRRTRRSAVRDADDMALDFEISHDEWISRLVFLGGLNRRDAELHAQLVEDGCDGSLRSSRAAGYPLARRSITEAT